MTSRQNKRSSPNHKASDDMLEEVTYNGFPKVTLPHRVGFFFSANDDPAEIAKALQQLVADELSRKPPKKTKKR